MSETNERSNVKLNAITRT